VILSPTLSVSSIAPVAILAAVSQILAKSLVFFAGRGIFDLSINKYKKKIDAVHQKFLEWGKKTDLLIFISAWIGIPPLYIVSIVAGMLRQSFVGFFFISLVGRILRFVLVLYFPHLFLKFF